VIVTAKSGNTVNMRATPSKTGLLICPVPVGSKVTVISKVNDEWSRIQYNKQVGFMMSQFLTNEPTAITKADLQNIYNSLSETLKLIDEVLKK